MGSTRTYTKEEVLRIMWLTTQLYGLWELNAMEARESEPFDYDQHAKS